MKCYKPNKLDPKLGKKLKDRTVSIIVDDFLNVDWYKTVKHFPSFSVYYNPTDFPKKYVIRVFDGTQPTRLIAIKNSLEEARKTIPTRFVCIQRSNRDPSSLVECWI